MHVDDQSLAERARQGDQQALVEIFDQYYPLIFRYIFFRVTHQEVAEDLAGEVFVRLVEKIGEYEARGRPLLAWLYTIARNLVVDYYRSRESSISEELPENVLATEGEADQEVEKRFVFEQLGRALVQLTEEQRQVVLLKFIEERSNTEVAVLLGKNERAIRSLQHRALLALQRALTEEGYDAK